MTIGERRVEGRILEKAEAKRAYGLSFWWVDMRGRLATDVFGGMDDSRTLFVHDSSGN